LSAWTVPSDRSGSCWAPRAMTNSKLHQNEHAQGHIGRLNLRVVAFYGPEDRPIGVRRCFRIRRDATTAFLSCPSRWGHSNWSHVTLAALRQPGSNPTRLASWLPARAQRFDDQAVARGQELYEF